MKLNIDDTKEEEYVSAMHRDTDVLLNCEKCHRLFYMDKTVANKRFDNGLSLLCVRCRNIK
jgi:hypothetical protein